METAAIIKTFREKGIINIKEGNGKVVTLLKPEHWTDEMGKDWTYLIFDLFQIRSLCVPFSEVSLDIVEFASKPTIYSSPVNHLVSNGPMNQGNLRFSLIREPHWNKLLFQLAQPVLCGIDKEVTSDFQSEVKFPLLSSSTKEMFLGPEGEVKIIKG
ncbi:MAG: hypothetical protein ACJLTB_10315 [Algoriphagus aquaeductus]|uniref:hypothetical protein n=1 Tax=Algoriphagus aquaeductus TaxID=475299 RepID=UPI0038799E80